MPTMIRCATLLGLAGLTLLTAATAAAAGSSNIDPSRRFAWGENIGWLNWRHERPAPGDGVFVSPRILAGFIWAENVGWLNVGDGDPGGPGGHELYYSNIDGSDFGVNIDPVTGRLSGFAWGENIGWINFAGGAAATPPNPARLDGCRLRGFAWGENVGWINLDDTTHFVEIATSALAGDLNCDCSLDFDDIEAFVSALVSETFYMMTYSGCDYRLAEVDCSGVVDFDDISVFVDCLIAGRCPPCAE